MKYTYKFEAIYTKPDCDRVARIVFRLHGDNERFAVVKLFNTESQQLHTVKLWAGTPLSEAVKHWSTNSKQDPRRYTGLIFHARAILIEESSRLRDSHIASVELNNESGVVAE